MSEVNVGVWLDGSKAIVVTLSNAEEKVTTILSEIEHFHLHGGSGSKVPYGPNDTVTDKRLLERKKRQQRQYFKNIFPDMQRASRIVVFGPAEVRLEFAKALQREPSLRNKLVDNLPADSMTDNQVKALVRDFYHAIISQSVD